MEWRRRAWRRRALLLPVLAGVGTVMSATAPLAMPAQTMAAPRVGGSGTMDNLPDTSGVEASSGRRRLSTLTVIPEDFSSLKLAPGFLLSMEALDAPEFSADLRVDAMGNVLVPTIGKVHVGGETIAEATSTIASRLEDAKILNRPQITLNITQYAGQSVTVLGEVRTPGRMELLAPHSLAEVIAMSGGRTQYAGNVIEIGHAAEMHAAKDVVHIPPGSQDRVLAETEVHPGDTITVPRAGIVYVLGGVHRPGGYLMQEGGELNVTEALALAYGTTMEAAVSSIHIVRKLPDGKVEEIPIAYRAIVKGKEASPRLLPEDVVYVPISKTKTVLGAGLVATAAQAAIYTR